MAWIDDCQTAEDVRRLARATEARRRASWAKPEPPPTAPEPPPVQSQALSDDSDDKYSVGIPLTVGGQPVKSTWEIVYEIRQQIKKMQDADSVRTPPKIGKIIAAVSRYFQVSVNDILSQRRTAAIVFPRQLAMYLAKTMTLKSLPEIGRRFGGRDHTTVLHGVRKIARLINTDSEIADVVAHLTTVLERSS